MALESQSDRVGFDEVYNCTRREHREVNRRIRRRRCNRGIDVVVDFRITWMLVYFGGWFDVGVGFVGLFFDEETSKVSRRSCHGLRLLKRSWFVGLMMLLC